MHKTVKPWKTRHIWFSYQEDRIESMFKGPRNGVSIKHDANLNLEIVILVISTEKSSSRPKNEEVGPAAKPPKNHLDKSN